MRARSQGAWRQLWSIVESFFGINRACRRLGEGEGHDLIELIE
jgi:hypothetical protein